MKFLQASVGSAFIAAAKCASSSSNHQIYPIRITIILSSHDNRQNLRKIAQIATPQKRHIQWLQKIRRKNTHTINAPKNQRYMISEAASEKMRFVSKSKVNYLEGTFQSVQSSFFCWLGCIKDLSAADRGDIVWEGERLLTGPRNLLPQD